MDQQTITSQLRQLFPSQPGADKDLFRGKKDQITDMQPNQVVLVTAVIWPISLKQTIATVQLGLEL